MESTELATSEIISIVIGIIGGILGILKRSEIKAFFDRIKLFFSKDYNKIGLYNFHPSRESLKKNFKDNNSNLIKDTKKELIIIALSLNEYINNDRDFLNTLLDLLKKKKDLSISVYLLNPESDMVKFYKKNAGVWGKLGLEKTISVSSNKLLEEKEEKLSEEDKERFSLFWYDSIIPSWLIASDIDEVKGKILIENHPFGQGIKERYTIELNNNSKPLYDVFKKSIIDFKADPGIKDMEKKDS